MLYGLAPNNLGKAKLIERVASTQTLICDAQPSVLGPQFKDYRLQIVRTDELVHCLLPGSCGVGLQPIDKILEHCNFGSSQDGCHFGRCVPGAEKMANPGRHTSYAQGGIRLTHPLWYDRSLPSRIRAVGANLLFIPLAMWGASDYLEEFVTILPEPCSPDAGAGSQLLETPGGFGGQVHQRPSIQNPELWNTRSDRDIPAPFQQARQQFLINGFLPLGALELFPDCIVVKCPNRRRFRNSPPICHHRRPFRVLRWIVWNTGNSGSGRGLHVLQQGSGRLLKGSPKQRNGTNETPHWRWEA